ncbi:uncharacterized protein LOC125779192 [Bactrocera dorsalis]|uniref:Uncharacterized protein LOC125779192 n=1 Tax=Bactrocera dorsalis TaxID=27457 RepID=A0ABM3K2T4_BACDO|nr:uncharacterized protein LOC125779192 [Bactrocera dorsalis]
MKSFPMQIEIASRVPICTLDAALDFEDKLNSKEFADETKIYLQQIKGANASVDEVMRKIFTDNVLFEFNFDGRKQKRALNKLKLVNEVLFDVFVMEGRPGFERALRRVVNLSHNRYRQNKLSLNKRSEQQQPKQVQFLNNVWMQWKNKKKIKITCICFILYGVG